MIEALAPARAFAGAVLLAAGLLALLAGVVGLARFPEPFTRLHALAASDGPGAALVAFGLAGLAPDPRTEVKLVLLGLLALWLAPLTAHVLGNAAHGAGLAPAAAQPAADDDA